ncbi:MAG TPA: M14 family metallopeptidase [Solirubrobacteraceae bacterium]|nr:M14 family metallopeptidase [Solirubrobacteraceae bacterium]
MVAAGLLVAAPAAADVRSLPPEQSTLTAGTAAARDCSTALRGSARDTAVRTYRAPISGFVSGRLSARSGDWDLVAFNSAGRAIASSEGFRAQEVVQTWVAAGDRVTFQGCRRTGRSRSARLSIHLVDVEPPAAGAKAELLRVEVGRDRGRFALLESLPVDVTHHVHDGHADVIVSGEAQKRLLRANGFEFTTRDPDLGRSAAEARRADARYGRRVGESPLPTGRTTYRTYDDIQSELKSLATARKDIVKPVVLPKRSLQGREIQGVEIAEGVNRAAEDGRPVYFVMATHHAREWPSAEAAMEFAHLLVDGYGKDERITDLLRRERIVVVPLVNPDGYVASRAHQGTDPYDNGPANPASETMYSYEQGFGVMSYRRKNCGGAFNDPNIPCDLQWGIDPNRNYGEKWGGPGASPDPSSQTYHGTGPWSEPETQAIHEYSQQRQVTALITLHNVAALVLRPPGERTQGNAPDEARLKEIGDAMAAATGYTSQYGFQLYDTTGTTEDWNYAAAGTFGYTIEIGPKGGKFHMPYEVGFVDEWTGETAGNGRGLREALLIGAEAAANPADHSVLVGKVRPGTTLRLKKTFVTRTSEYCPAGYYGPWNWEHPVLRLGKAVNCPTGKRPAIEVADGLNSTLTPPERKFEWHVTPSTRPFVLQGQVIRGEISTTPSHEQTFSGDLTSKADAVGKQELGQDVSASESEHTFTVTAEQQAARLQLDLDWEGNVDDYDLYVYRRKADGTLEPAGFGTGNGSSGNSLAEPEHLVVEAPAPGEYVARVRRYMDVEEGGAYTLKVSQFQREPDTVIPGRREPWTLTCERNGQVLGTMEVFVDRGQRLDVTLPKACR